MKNLNPIYLLEVETKTILHAAKKVNNSLVKSGMPKKKAWRNVSKRVKGMLDRRQDKIDAVNKLPKALRSEVEKTPKFWNIVRNRNNIQTLFWK
jgi:hypothetical protein